jgi:hypothetical protein
MMVLHVASQKEKMKQSPTKNNTNSIVTMNLLGKGERNLNLKAKKNKILSHLNRSGPHKSFTPQFWIWLQNSHALPFGVQLFFTLWKHD